MTKQTENKSETDILSPRTICVFCGARAGASPEYVKLAEKLGQDIAKNGHKLVYGGGGLGLMGAVARAAHNNGAHVLGIIPHFLKAAEKLLANIEHQYVETMHERKIAMFEEADAFIVLPGGIGTLEEAIEVLSWLRLNLHTKPVIFLSDTGYWDSLLSTLHHVVDEDFASVSMRDDILSANSVKEAFNIMEQEITNPRPREPLGLPPIDDNVDDFV